MGRINSSHSIKSNLTHIHAHMLYSWIFHRKEQLEECDDIMEVLEDEDPCSLLGVTREVVERGLLVPQDRPKV